MDINQLTKEEKIKLLTGSGNWHTSDLNGKIKSIQLSDGPHGLRAQSERASSNNDSIVASCFPTASATACSFHPELLKEMANAIAEEAQEAGVSVVLGPGVNMKRSPVCGRNFEYFSEDPYLAGEMATGFVNGLQEKKVAASLKHFAGNSQETHRMTANSEIDERALCEIYLRAFEKVVKNAKPATVMASYNMLNGKPACENEWLLTEVLRNRWGFDGLVMSDWGACVDLSACVNAGMDLEMPDSHGNHSAKDADEGAIQRAANNVLKLVENYPAKEGKALERIPEELLDKHYQIAKKVELESAVLLKNDNALPLSSPKKVIIIGDLAEAMRIQGGGSSHIHTRELSTILSAFKEAGVSTMYLRGYDSTASSNAFGKKDQKLLDEAVLGLKYSLAAEPDIPVLILGGLTDKAEGEGYDRETYDLPKNQIRLYEEIEKVTKNVIFVSFGGSPYNMEPISYAKAILSMYLGGEAVAEACVDLLLGKTNPSGRLAETWPNRLEDTPCAGNFGRQSKHPNDVEYKESLFIGYRYYDTFGVPVQYPFGYGLSYTSFEYQNLQVDGRKVSVEITNTGACEGFETVLVFVKNPSSDMIRAQRELRAFAKIKLAPGETRQIELELDDRAFEVYDAKRKEFISIAGEYTIEVSKFVGNVLLEQKVLVEGETPENQRALYPSYFKGAKEHFKDDEFDQLYAMEKSDFSNIKPGEFSVKNSLSQMAPYSSKARRLIRIGRLAARFITRAPLDDPESRMILEGISEGNIDSVCNQSGGFIKHKAIEKIVMSANKGGKE